MKNFYLISIFTSLFLLASCGGNKEGAQINMQSDSAQTAEQESPVAGPVDYYLTADSIGPIRVGESISALPTAVPNLYDMMITDSTPIGMAYTFCLGTVPQFTVYDMMEGKVNIICLEQNARGVMTPRGELRVGDEFTKVLLLDGVESEWENYDDGGIWYWKWNGLFFGVDEMGLSENFADMLEDEDMPPRASAFNSKIKIGYIGTGLPF